MRERFYGKIDLNDQIFQNLPLLVELGINLELCITDSTFLYEKFPPLSAQLKDTIRQMNLQTIFHLPFYGLQLGCKDHYIQELSFKLVMQGLKRSSELEIRRAVMHIGFPQHMPLKGKDKWLQAFYNNLDKILEYCHRQEITLYLENTFEPDPTIFEEILQNYKDNRLAVCLDIAHIYCYSDVKFVDWWKVLGERTGHIHLSDNKGNEDSHLILGTGFIDFREIWQHTNSQALTYTLETEIASFTGSLAFLNSIIDTEEKVS